MKHIRLYIIALLPLLTNNSANAQLAFSPGDTSLHYEYIKDRNVFQKLVWIDSNGVTTRTAILNLITKIDTIQHTVTYLQNRNDGKRDSSVSSYPNLVPLYLSSKGSQFMETYDYHHKGMIAIHIEREGKVTYEGNEPILDSYFDSYLGDLVMTTLPVEKMKPFKFSFYNNSLKKIGGYEITKISQDVLLGLYGKNIPIYALSISTGKNEFLVYLDKRSRQVLKTVFVAENGASFIKELL